MFPALSRVFTLWQADFWLTAGRCSSLPLYTKFSLCLAVSPTEAAVKADSRSTCYTYGLCILSFVQAAFAVIYFGRFSGQFFSRLLRRLHLKK